MVCQFINIIYCASWVKHFTTLRMGRRRMTLVHDCLLAMAQWYWQAVTIVIWELSSTVAYAPDAFRQLAVGLPIEADYACLFPPLLTQDVEPFFTTTPCHHSSLRTM
jgi:hypothetical protein